MAREATRPDGVSASTRTPRTLPRDPVPGTPTGVLPARLMVGVAYCLKYVLTTADSSDPVKDLDHRKWLDPSQ
jgi:hypothetical protein